MNDDVINVRTVWFRMSTLEQFLRDAALTLELSHATSYNNEAAQTDASMNIIEKFLKQI